MELQDVYQKLNTLKKSTEKKIIIFYSVVILFVLILFITGSSSTGVDLFIFRIILCLVGIIVLAVGHYYLTKNYKSTFKTFTIPLALKQLGDEITYQEKGLSKETAKETDMFGTFSVFKSEDLVCGKISDVTFSSSDVRLGYYVSTGKSTTYVPVCHGQLYIFDFNKSFKTKMIIRERNMGTPSGLTKVKLESETFNHQFKIYSNNEHETFYLLTPHFMEKLLKLEQNHKGDLFIAFYNHQLHIGIHNNKDRFKPPLFTNFNQLILDNQLDDLNIIKEIIEELNLNIQQFK